MKRNLLNQMKKEWRDNVWLVIELAVVCLAIWGLSVIVYVQGKGLFIPRGFNPENVYSISLKTVSSGSPNYIDLGETQMPPIVPISLSCLEGLERIRMLKLWLLIGVPSLIIIITMEDNWLSSMGKTQSCILATPATVVLTS